MSEQQLLMRAPPMNEESRPFYQAASEGRFTLRRCLACKKTHWYPRALCPFCFGETEWIDGSGRGTLYSFSIMRKATPPYVLAYVTLDEGPTMMTNMVDCEFEQLKIGQRVVLRWVPSDGGPPLPCFTPWRDQ